MARKEYPKWTEDEIEFLLDNYYKYTVSELATKLNRTKAAVKLKHSTIINKNHRKQRVILERCPDCNKPINDIGNEGYYCKYCLKEFDRYGEFMAPLSANG